MGEMERATFCPVMAPERQATRSLPAAVLSGCIPVFFGPPFHALPLAADIRYAAFSLFFHLTESASYQPQVGASHACTQITFFVLHLGSPEVDQQRDLLKSAR